MLQKNSDIKINPKENESKKHLKFEKSKSTSVKEDIKEQGKKASEILSNSKKFVKEKKGDVIDKIEDIKEDASEKNKEIKEKMGNIQEEDVNNILFIVIIYPYLSIN